MLLLSLPACREAPPAEPGAEESGGAEPAAAAAAGPTVAQPPRHVPRLEAGTTAGALGEESGLLDDGSRFQAYLVEAEGHQRLRIRARSDHFDPVLYLVDPAGTPVAFNDDEDSKAGAAAGLDAYLAAPGPHQVWVNAFSGGAGAFELALEVDDHAEAGRTLAAGSEAGGEARGWLTPADERGPAGRPVDRWRFTLPAEPALVWLEATEFDPRLAAGAGGASAAVNDDLDPIGGDRRARIALIPGPGRPAGSEVTLAVEASDQGPPYGGYRLWTTPLPLDRRPELALRLRPLLISCPGDSAEHEQWAGDFLRAAALADEVWSQCGIRVELEAAPRVVCVPGLPWVVRVGAADWTPDEERLQALPERAGPHESLLTVFAVGGTDGGERHALAYPTTRYAPGRAGIVLGRGGLERGQDEVFLAHEIGHVLGLGHSAEDDGDPGNDVAGNVMSVAFEEDAAPAQDARELSQLQCAIARGAPHWLTAAAAHGGGAPSRPRGLARTDRVLRPGEDRVESLAEGDPTHAEGRKIDVFYFTGSAGESIAVEASSSELDPILLLDGPAGDRLAMDDDGGGGRTARIELTLTSGGDHSVGVTSALPGEIGSYRLVLSRP